MGEFEIKREHISTELILEKDIITLGEELYMSYVVENLTDHDLQIIVGGDYRNKYGRPDSFGIRTMQSGLYDVSIYQVRSEGGLIGPKKIPAHGTYTFSLLLSNWANISGEGDYTITATRILKLLLDSQLTEQASNITTDITTAETAYLKILPIDPIKLGFVIDELGEQLTPELNSIESSRALQKLSKIDDKRVIPYLLKALKTDNYTFKLNSLRALAKFDDKSAFEGLKLCLETNGETNGNIITAAIHGVAASPYSEAKEYLLSRRDSEINEVRLTVVHALGRMNAEKAIPILEFMVDDEYELVRIEAKRYLKELEAQD